MPAGERFVQHVGRKRMLEKEDKQRAAIPEHKKLRDEARALREQLNTELAFLDIDSADDVKVAELYSKELDRIKALESRAGELEDSIRREKEQQEAEKKAARQREIDDFLQQAEEKFPIKEGDLKGHVELMKQLRERFLRYKVPADVLARVTGEPTQASSENSLSEAVLLQKFQPIELENFLVSRGIGATNKRETPEASTIPEVSEVPQEEKKAVNE